MQMRRLEPLILGEIELIGNGGEKATVNFSDNLDELTRNLDFLRAMQTWHIEQKQNGEPDLGHYFGNRNFRKPDNFPKNAPGTREHFMRTFELGPSDFQNVLKQAGNAGSADFAREVIRQFQGIAVGNMFGQPQNFLLRTKNQLGHPYYSFVPTGDPLYLHMNFDENMPQPTKDTTYPPILAQFWRLVLPNISEDEQPLIGVFTDAGYRDGNLRPRFIVASDTVEAAVPFDNATHCCPHLSVARISPDQEDPIRLIANNHTFEETMYGFRMLDQEDIRHLHDSCYTALELGFADRAKRGQNPLKGSRTEGFEEEQRLDLGGNSLCGVCPSSKTCHPTGHFITGCPSTAALKAGPE